MKKVKIADWKTLEVLTPTYALVAGVDLVIVRWEDASGVSVLYGRCRHRGALMSDGTIRGEDLVCGVHDWDYRYKTGVSGYNNDEKLHRFSSWVEKDGVWVDEDEVAAWEKEFHAFMRQRQSELWQKLDQSKALDDETVAQIDAAIAEFQQQYAGTKETVTV